MVDAAHDKEQRARETIQSLKLEISNLSKLVEQGAGLSMGQDHRFENCFSSQNLCKLLLLCSMCIKIHAVRTIWFVVTHHKA